GAGGIGCPLLLLSTEFSRRSSCAHRWVEGALATLRSTVTPSYQPHRHCPHYNSKFAIEVSGCTRRPVSEPTSMARSHSARLLGTACCAHSRPELRPRRNRVRHASRRADA